MTKRDRYLAARREIEIRLEKGGDLIADLGNVVAVLKKRLDYYWTGFYFFRGDKLVLGPFQGTPACVFLSCDQGVCAEAAKRKETVIVADVTQFPGHIVCDSSSRSEIAVPCVSASGYVAAVLDIDHDQPDSFDKVDREELEKLSEMLQNYWNTLSSGTETSGIE